MLEEQKKSSPENPFEQRENKKTKHKNIWILKQLIPTSRKCS
jgi:hypothetical protein